MGMNRAQMISIVNSMSDDSLMKAMSAVGIDAGGGEGDQFDPGDEEADGLQSWNSRDVSVEAAPRPPIVDKSKFEKMAPQPQQGMRPDYGADPDMSGITEYMPQEGMDEQ